MKYSDLSATLISMSGDQNVIVVRKPFVKFVGSLEGAMMLSQLLYWTPRSTMGGWIAKTTDEFTEELCLTEYALRAARSKLEGMGILETKVKRFQGNPVTHYRLNLESLDIQWSLWIQSNVPANSKEPNPGFSENKTETTPEDTSIENKYFYEQSSKPSDSPQINKKTDCVIGEPQRPVLEEKSGAVTITRTDISVVLDEWRVRRPQVSGFVVSELCKWLDDLEKEFSVAAAVEIIRKKIRAQHEKLHGKPCVFSVQYLRDLANQEAPTYNKAIWSQLSVPTPEEVEILTKSYRRV